MRARWEERARAATRLSLVAIVAMLIPACATLRGSYPVEVGGRTAAELDVGRLRESVPAAYLRFFPESITLHPGDAVRFQLQGSGEPHTVTLGTVVQSVATALDEAPEMTRTQALAGLPKPFDRGPNGVRVNAAAVRAGKEQPPFDGREKYFSSGLLDASNDVFRMELDDSIRPGRYAFLCLVHPELMRGTLEVVAPDSYRPRPKAVMQRADEEEEETAESLAAGARAALEATPTRAVAGLPASAGIAAYLATFGQDTYRIKRGGSVKWTVFGTHTITFGTPPAGARDGFVVERGEIVEANRALWAPAGSPGAPTDAQLRAASARRDVIDIKATWDGTDRLHSGILSSRNSGTLRYSVTFSRRGTYEYSCLVHPRMRGTVVVT